MQKPESIVQIIHTHVWKSLHFSIDYANKTLCTHTIFYSEVEKKVMEKLFLKKNAYMDKTKNVSNILP